MSATNPTEIHEILAAANTKKTHAAILKILNPHSDNKALRYILQGAYDDNISSYLPIPGAPPYVSFDMKGDEPPDSLNGEAKTIYNFFQFTYGSKQPRIEMEKSFIELLARIHPEDADIIIRMKDKTLNEKYPNLKKSVIATFLTPWAQIK